MAVKLRGNAWYLKKSVDGVTKEFPLGFYGGEADRKKAEKAGVKMAKEIDQAKAAAKMLERLGLSPKVEEEAPAVLTLAEWWAKYRRAFGHKKSPRVITRDLTTMTTWLQLPFRPGQTWGETPLDKFKQSDCAVALAVRGASQTANKRWKQSRPLKEGTVRRERGLVQAVFRKAVEDGLIAANPFAGIPRGKDQVKNRLLLPEQEAAFLAALPTGTDKAPHNRWRRFVELTLETGLRLEGMRTLDPAMIRNGALHVSEKSRKHSNYCPVCKREGRKCRDVALSERAVRLINEQMAEDGEMWPQNESRIRELMRATAVRAGLKDEQGNPMSLSPHDLRHTFGHRYLLRGGTLEDLQEILGHEDIGTTRRHYSHLRPQEVHARMRDVMARPLPRMIAPGDGA